MACRVSILIPCYNKRAYVAQAIESALQQTAPCEVIVIDDGSTDGSLQEVRRFGKRIIWETGPNRGGSAARNRGLALAKGELIQFLDADDVLPPEKIATQLAALNGVGPYHMAFCPWSFFHDNGLVMPPDPRRYWHDYPDGLSLLVDMWTWGGFFPPHAWLVPRLLIHMAGSWDERLTGDDDGEFFGRLLAQADGVHFCGKTRVLYRDPPEGAVSRNRSLKSVRSIFDAYLSVSGAILAQRDDARTRRACLSRLRDLAYQLRHFDDILDRAAAEEHRLGLRHFSPRLPWRTRILISLLGLGPGLRLYRTIEARLTDAVKGERQG